MSPLTQSTNYSAYRPDWPGLSVIEANPGLARQAWLKHQLAEFKNPYVRAIPVSCDFEAGGPWAGVNDLFSALLPEMEASSPQLLEKHSFELVYILPQLSRTLAVRNPNLTDLSWGHERTRNYPADRAYRNVHGLINLLDSWKAANCPDIQLIVACDYFDLAGALGSLFFRELLRRRGERLKIHLLLAVAPGRGDFTRSSFDLLLQSAVTKLDFPLEVTAEPDQAESDRLASELEERIGNDRVEKKTHLSDLLHLWHSARRPDKLLHLQYFGLETYNTAGQYADALRYGAGLLDLASEYAPADKFLRWSIVLKLIMSHLGLDDAAACMRLAEEEGLTLAKDQPYWSVQLFYLIAMLYARFMKPRNLAKGEEYLDLALQAIDRADLPEDERHFNRVFNRNGLAMIRNFQGRHAEAIAFCRNGIETLNAHLSADEHLLHRSILVYNMAQVYAASGAIDQAIEHYSSAIDMDPNYSEYYNDRGNIYLSQNRLSDAEREYRKAIELSPPYFEVFTNLGQCLRRQGSLENAYEAYSRALDIQPSQLLALLGRAKTFEELGQREAAINDYTMALALDSTQWEALASRGVLRYESGDLRQALGDFNNALLIHKSSSDLFQNRATILIELGRFDEAASDLQLALSLNPPEEDRALIEAKLKDSLQVVV